MTKKGIDLTVIIVNWNTCTLLAQCLHSIHEEAARSERPHFEIVVVDNHSSDGSFEMVRCKFPLVRVIKNSENVGFARANNQAMRASSGRYVLLLNSDTIIHRGALQALIDFMDNNPLAGAAGARLVNVDGSIQHACHPMLTPEREFWRLVFLDRVWQKSTYEMESWDMFTPRKVQVIKGACLVLRRQALNQVGLLDERYYMYAEEVDLCYRLGVGGWELWYVPDAAVTHFGGASSEQMREEMYVQLYRSKVQFFRKFWGDWSARRYKILTALANLPRAALRPREPMYRRLLSELPSM